MTAGDKWMADNRVALLEPGDAPANLFNPAGVLVPHDVRQIDVGFFAPDAFDDMEIGSANAGTADADDHVCWSLDARIDDIVEADELLGAQSFVVTMQNGGFHLPVPSFLCCLSAASIFSHPRSATAVPALQRVEISSQCLKTTAGTVAPMNNFPSKDVKPRNIMRRSIFRPLISRGRA